MADGAALFLVDFSDSVVSDNKTYGNVKSSECNSDKVPHVERWCRGTVIAETNEVDASLKKTQRSTHAMLALRSRDSQRAGVLARETCRAARDTMRDCRTLRNVVDAERRALILFMAQWARSATKHSGDNIETARDSAKGHRGRDC